MARKSGHTAGAMDIRNIIGTLLTIYGVILVFLGLFADKAYDRTGDVNANLIAGLALTVVGVGFITWAKLKPVVVPDDVEPEPDGPAVTTE